MSCRVVAAGTREMAVLIAQALQTINFWWDDEDGEGADTGPTLDGG